MRLHSRIYLHSLAVLVVACGTIVSVLAIGARGGFMRDAPHRLARHVASLAAEDLHDAARLQARLQRIHDDLDIDVTVRDVGGRVLARSGREQPPLPRGALEAMWRDAAGLHMRRMASAAAAVRDPASGAVMGFVQTSVRGDRGIVPPVRPLLVVLAVLLIVAVLTVPTARRITRPVRRLIDATTRFGGGDLSARAPVTAAVDGRPARRRRRGDELRELTLAFNDMADRVERLVRSQRELVANASHELRSPLTRIRMAMDLLPADAATAARRRDVETDLADLDRLIDDVLTTARLEETGLPTRLETCDVRRVLTDVAERARHDPLVAGGEVRVTDGPAVAVWADEALLRRALWNLVENAAKYGAPPVTLAAEPTPDGVTVSVTDDGPGIPAADRERVFEPFYRGDRARTPDGRRGVGLGLTLARRIAEVHGGTIGVAAASVDSAEHGCRIVITLPARPPA